MVRRTTRGVSALLADAILKRPGSIGARAPARRSRGALPEAFGFGAGAGVGEEVEVGAERKSGEGKGVVVEEEDDGEPLEFTFPSLSDALGNAYYRARPSRAAVAAVRRL